MAKAKKLADALKKVKTSVKEGMTKSQIKKRAAEKKEEVSQLKAKLKDQAKFDASSKSSFKGKTPDKSSKSKAIETRKVNERNKRLQKEADSKSKKTKDLDDENSAPLKFKDGSGKKGVKKPQSIQDIKKARKRHAQDIAKFKEMKRRAGQKRKVIKEPTKAENIAKTKRMPSRMKGGGVAKKAAGGMMSPQPMPARSRPPMPPRPPKPRFRPKPRTELIDPRLPRGKAGKGPAEPRDSTTRVISQPPKKKMKFGERIRKDRGLPQMPPKGSIRATSRPAGSIPPLEQGPGMKDGGSVKAYKAGRTVSKSKATGAAKRGFGKAYMKGKR